MFKKIINFYSEAIKSVKEVDAKIWYVIIIKTIVILLLVYIFYPSLFTSVEWDIKENTSLEEIK